MTKRRIVQSLAAASLMTSVAIAGTVSSNSVGLISSELLSFSDANLSQPLSAANANVVYTPSKIPAGSLKNPIFKFVFDNVSDLQVGDIEVYEVLDGNESNADEGNLKLVADTPTQSDDPNNPNAKVLSFNASSGDIYVYNSKKYVIRDSNSSGDTDLNITVKQGSTSPVTIAAYLYSGDSQAQNDDTPASVLATVGEEITATVSKKLNARIDAANSFYTFFDQFDGNNKHDALVIDVTQNSTIQGGGLTDPMANIVVYSDQNLTKNSYSVTTTFGQATANDTNVTVDPYDATTGEQNTITYIVDGLSKIEKTNFGVDLWITATGTTDKFMKITKTDNNAGAWTIYGYNAQIPNVQAKPGVYETTLKFTNRSTLDSDIFFTLIDQDGTVVSLSSADTSLPSIAAGTTSVYKASDLLALVTDADFNKDDSFSVEVSIPTTPSSVYGFASWKNLSVTPKQFKDLPIYNTSNMTY